MSLKLRYIRLRAPLKLGTFALLVLLSVCSRSASADNVLLLIADDYGVDSMGLYSGAGAAPTPVLDSLAANGVRFTDFWANPICSPTRAAILTGRHGFRTGVGSPTGNHQIPLDEFSIANAVSAAGYRTACIGKWHLSGGSNGGASNPNLMGFDHFSGSLSGGVPDYFDWSKTVNGVSADTTNYATSETVDDAIDWITSAGNQPWFCWVAFNAPHTPFHLPPTDLHSFDSLSGTAEDISANPLPYYQAMVESLDTEVGRLLGAIDPSVLGNTTVIFIGDNGTPRDVATGFERGQKGQLFQGGVHVPCIVSGASVAAPLGRTHDARFHVVDLFDTIAELCGVQTSDVLPDGTFIDSESIVPYLIAPNLPNAHDITFAERFTVAGANQDGKTVRNAQYKLIWFDNGNERFYDLQSDPLESTNLTIGNNGGPRAQNYEILSNYLANLLTSPTAPIVESVEINYGEAQRSALTTLAITLDSPADVDDSTGSPITITHVGSGETVETDLTMARVDGKTQITVEFVPGNVVIDRNILLPTLANGTYLLTIDASLVTWGGKSLDGDNDGVAGGNYVYGDDPEEVIFRKYGDVDGDEDVDLVDFASFRGAFGKAVSDPTFPDHLDVDGNGLIDLIDFSAFRAGFGN